MQNNILKNDLKDLIYIYKKFYFGKYLVLNMYYIKDYIFDKFLTVKLDTITRHGYPLSPIPVAPKNFF